MPRSLFVLINLEIESDRKTLSQLIKNDINEYCVKKYDDGFRNHLGASLMGEACSRKLWYHFRWFKHENIDGRIQRLFNVGHEAEPRFMDYLSGIGFEVKSVDPNTKKQFRIEGSNGHYGGSLDGICTAPERYNLKENLVLLDEFKTNGTGASFNDVETKGLRVAKPKHYAQMCQYGAQYKLKFGLYLIENKNDSDITIQVVELDWNYGKQLQLKANDIINTHNPPNRISDQPSYFECKWCTYQEICHFNAESLKNCRTCKNSKPVENAEWYCGHWNIVIPHDYLIKGCDKWIKI